MSGLLGIINILKHVQRLWTKYWIIICSKFTENTIHETCIGTLLCFLKRSILVCLTKNWRHTGTKMKYVFLEKWWLFFLIYSWLNDSDLKYWSQNKNVWWNTVDGTFSNLIVYFPILLFIFSSSVLIWVQGWWDFMEISADKLRILLI